MSLHNRATHNVRSAATLLYCSWQLHFEDTLYLLQVAGPAPISGDKTFSLGCETDVCRVLSGAALGQSINQSGPDLVLEPLSRTCLLG
jgi:hypothetical protein